MKQGFLHAKYLQVDTPDCSLYLCKIKNLEMQQRDVQLRNASDIGKIISNY
jgi:hypothetical protein